MNRTAAGIGLALCTALISGVAIFVNSYAVREVADAALFTSLKNGVAALALLGLTLAAVRRPTLERVSGRSWLAITVVGILGGGLAFLLFFSGLAMASAPSAAFIHKTLFVWVALLALPFLGERLGLLQVGALGVLLASQLLITPPTGVVWGIGETLIAAATLLWAVEVVLARRLLAQVDSLVLGVGRLGIGLIVLFGYVTVSGKLPLIAGLGAAQWTWVVVTGLFLAGYVATWYAALSRAPATVVTSVLVLGAPITVLLNALVTGTIPAAAVLLGQVLIVTGALALIAFTLRRSRPALLESAPS